MHSSSQLIADVMLLADLANSRVEVNGVDSFYDSFLLAAGRLVEHAPEQVIRLSGRHDEIARLAGIVRQRVRFQRASERRAYQYDLPPDRLGYQNPDSDIPVSVMQASQGVLDCVRHRGLPLYKTVFDYALYPILLAELRPRTIVEIGSGSGASAMWLSDLARSLDLTHTEVWTFDLEPPEIDHPGVHVGWVDCADPETIPVDLVSRLPHPILVIEDVHINVANVLRRFHPCLVKGDYFYIEDTSLKVADMRAFMAQMSDKYLIDTRFTDFFGRNATCAADGILIRS